MGKLIQFPSHRVVHSRPEPEISEEYDYCVVGLGAHGSALAAHLSS